MHFYSGPPMHCDRRTFLRRLSNAGEKAKLQRRSCDEGEILVEPGIVRQSLFIAGNGGLPMTRDEIEGEVEAMRLGPGDHFGEIGLPPGLPRP